MTKAIILARVSTMRQEKEGLSLKEIQLPILQTYAKERGFEVVKEFVFSESADRKIRKKFDEMVEFVKSNSGIKVIITFRVDRITRNYRDAVAIDDLRLDFGKEIHFVDDKLVINAHTVGRDIQDWDLKVFLAKQYINRLKEDAVNSASYMLRNGLWTGKAPFGYRNVVLENKKKWIAIELFEAQVVEKIYEWYSTGSYSMFEIRKKVKAVFNLDFSKGSIDEILKRKFYYGIMERDGKEYPHNYEPIITKSLFDKVQLVKAGYHKKHFKFAGLPYLYRGLIRCSVCGCMVTPEKKKGKYIYYHCTQYNGKHDNASWLREEDLTKQFAKLYEGLQLPPDVVEDITNSLRESHKAKSQFHSSLLENYQTEYKMYENRIEKMYTDKLDGRITESYYDQKREEFRGKQKEISDKMDKLNVADEEYYITSSYLLKLASKAKELFESSEPEEKRLLLKKTLQNLRLEGDLVRYDLLKPYDKVLSLASRQAWLP